MSILQSIILKLVLPNKDKIIAMALVELAKLYQKSRAKLMATVNNAIIDSPLAATATPSEMDALFTAIENWFKTNEFIAVEHAIFQCLKKQ
jgi:hypothetical protein